MARLRTLVESNFSLVLLLSSLAGLLLPGLGTLPNEAAVVTMALLMFVACYKLRDGGFSAIRWKDVLLFCLLRYGVLSVLLWAITYALLHFGPEVIVFVAISEIAWACLPTLLTYFFRWKKAL